MMMFPSVRGVSSAWNVIRNQTLLGLPTLEDPLVRKMGKRVFLVARKLKKTFSVTMYTCQNVCHIQYVHRLLPEVSGDFLRKKLDPTSLRLDQQVHQILQRLPSGGISMGFPDFSGILGFDDDLMGCEWVF